MTPDPLRPVVSAALRAYTFAACLIAVVLLAWLIG